MSIFDSISGNLSSLTDALAGGFLTNKQQTANDRSQNQDYKTLRQTSLLNANVEKMSANPRPGQYAVTPSKAPVSVDPNDVQSEWLRRLDNYSTIAAKTGVKIK